MDSATLARALAVTHERNTEALLVVHNDRIVHEWYAPGYGPDSRLTTASMQKGLAGGLGLALLLEDGRLDPDDRASRWIEAWGADSLRSRITVRHLATHSSGLEHAGEPGVPHDELSGWKGLFWERRDGAASPIQLALTRTPLVAAPGEELVYSGPGFAALAYVMTAALDGSPHRDLRSLLEARVYRPIGLDDDDWSIGYGRPFETDGLRVWGTWGGGRFTARALARIGRLMLHRGTWEGVPILDPAALEHVVRYRGTPIGTPGEPSKSRAPGLGWWTNEFGVWSLPRNAFAATAGQRLLMVVPSMDLVIVRLGDALQRPDEDLGANEAIDRYLIEPLLGAMGEPPVPWSERLGGAWFEPLSSVVCEAEGSDNWPITWGDDGTMYAAYGDGWGFAPRTDRKLSLGFARIEGEPESFLGINIRSPDGERTGDGPSGPKASGMLEVDDVLYMWVRNLDNSRLAWSEDHGRSWTWGFRFRESFGSPTFLQFGPGYQGARDGFVYVYSQDGPSAYEADDRLVLARAARDSVRHREAYEFFAGLDAAGVPRWSRDLEAREGVFRHPNGVRRSEVVYEPWTRRYLLALGFDGSPPGSAPRDTSGAWGLFGAPEPWGPWSTLYFTPRWEVANTHSFRLPTKWIRDGGRTYHLVFSGRESGGRSHDAFCVRRFRLLPTPRRGSR